MKYLTPWSSLPEFWKEFVRTTTNTDPNESCLIPPKGLPPVVHKFYDFVILPEGPIELPSPLPSSNEFPNSPPTGGNIAPVFGRAEALKRVFPWYEDNIKWGIFSISEQAWYWQGRSLGELFESLSLTPKEKLEIKIHSWDKTKMSRDMESSDLVDKKSETSLTMHHSSQVIRRMEKEKSLELGANIGVNYVITAGLELNYGIRASDALERKREKRQEHTGTTSQQMRNERKLTVSTVREIGVDEKRKRVISNPNPTHSITYNFYETLTHYKVETAPVEIRWAVAIPNELPEITPEWIVCHEGILREHLLDDSHLPAFEAARRIVNRYPQDRIREAATKLFNAFCNQPGRFLEAGGPAYVELTGGDLRYYVWQDNRRNFEVHRRTPGHSYVVESTPTPAGPIMERYSFEFIKKFLNTVRREPSIAGLYEALRLLEEWYLPWRTTAVSSDFDFYPKLKEMDEALGFAYSIFVQETEQFPSFSPEWESTNGIDNEVGEEDSEEQDEEMAHWRFGSMPKLQEWRQDNRYVETLRCHINENILHYMRPIWLAEEPTMRYKRITRQLLHDDSSEAEQLIGELIEEPMLGFHLNCSIYPVFMTVEMKRALAEALETENRSIDNIPIPATFRNLTIHVAKTGERKLTEIETHFTKLAHDRFQSKGNYILDEAIRNSIRHVLNCKPSIHQFEDNSNLPNILPPSLLPEIMTHASAEISDHLKQSEEQLAFVLTKSEKEWKDNVVSRLRNWKEATVDENAFRQHMVAIMNLDAHFREILEHQDYKPIMVTIPDGGYHCEPVVGECSAAEALYQRELEAQITLKEVELDLEKVELERRKMKLEANELDGEQRIPSFNIRIEKNE